MNERKFINEAVKKLLVSEYIKKETENAGFGGMEMKRTPFGTNITLYANKPGLVIGRHGSKVQEITENLEKKYKIESPQIEVKEIDNPDLNPQVVSKKIALSLEKGWAYRKAGNTSLRRIAENGARGVIISISGKISGERGRMQKFMTGSVKYSGEPARAGMERGFSIAKLKLGVIGVKVGILRSQYKLPDDYTVAQELGVSTPKLIQEPQQEAPEVKEPPKEPRKEAPKEEKPKQPAKEKPRVIETPVPKEKPAEKPAEKKPEAKEEKLESPKPEPEKKPEEKKEGDLKAEPKKPEAEKQVKAEEKKPEPEAQKAKPAEEAKAEAPEPEKKEKKAAKAKATKEKKTAAKAKKAASEKKESKSSAKSKKKEAEENGTEGKKPETDEQ